MKKMLSQPWWQKLLTPVENRDSGDRYQPQTKRAIISSIVLPLMVISSMYGMNFAHMPELQGEYSLSFSWERCRPLP
jgi:hypothetical protein